MKVHQKSPPRRFVPDPKAPVTILDCGEIELEANEMVTFSSTSGTAYDVGRKSWGYYATPSLNARLPAHGLRPGLMCNSAGRYYVILVEKNCEPDFRAYLAESDQKLVAWLDDETVLGHIAEITTINLMEADA